MQFLHIQFKTSTSTIFIFMFEQSLHTEHVGGIALSMPMSAFIYKRINKILKHQTGINFNQCKIWQQFEKFQIEMNKFPNFTFNRSAESASSNCNECKK